MKLYLLLPIALVLSTGLTLLIGCNLPQVAKQPESKPIFEGDKPAALPKLERVQAQFEQQSVDEKTHA